MNWIPLLYATVMAFVIPMLVFRLARSKRSLRNEAELRRDADSATFTLSFVCFWLMLGSQHVKPDFLGEWTAFFYAIAIAAVQIVARFFYARKYGVGLWLGRPGASGA